MYGSRERFASFHKPSQIQVLKKKRQESCKEHGSETQSSQRQRYCCFFVLTMKVPRTYENSATLNFRRTNLSQRIIPASRFGKTNTSNTSRHVRGHNCPKILKLVQVQQGQTGFLKLASRLRYCTVSKVRITT